jgi:hypothetical protein
MLRRTTASDPWRNLKDRIDAEIADQLAAADSDLSDSNDVLFTMTP